MKAVYSSRDDFITYPVYNFKEIPEADEPLEWDEAIDAAERFVNELSVKHLGLLALNFSNRYNSASRNVMFGTQLSQSLPVKGANEKRIQTGIEQEMSRYTFDVRMPANGRIVRIIDRYERHNFTNNPVDHTPEITVIYEDQDTGAVSCFFIPKFASHHQIFGFEYVRRPELSLIYPGNYIRKDTVFMDPPIVRENGGLALGISVNACYASFPEGAEDGCVISKRLQQLLKYRIYEKRSVEIGSTHFPLNLFGSIDNYQPFPGIGEYVREDGLLMVLRAHNVDFSPVLTSIYNVREPDLDFDIPVYARPGRGKVVDIKVIANHSPNKQLPEAMTGFLEKYSSAYRRYCEEVIRAETELRREHYLKCGDNKLKIAPHLQRLLVEARGVVNHKPGNFGKPTERASGNVPVLNLLHRKAQIDEYRIEFVIEYEMTPTIGNKLSDFHGGKGIIVAVWDDDLMPVDEDGNRADYIADSGSGSHRMIYGRFYEHFLTSAMRDVTKRVCHIMGIEPPAGANDPSEKPRKWIDAKYIGSLDAEKVHRAWVYLMQFYKETSKKQFTFFKQRPHYKEQHLAYIAQSGLYLNIPVEQQRQLFTITQRVQKKFHPTFGPVRFKDTDGRISVTVDPVRIAETYIILLDKVPEEGFSTVATGRLQHFGLLSPITRSEKFAFPYRNAAVRTGGETELRLKAGVVGAEAVAETFDRSNSPATQRALYYNLVEADRPTDIEHVVDRSKVEFGHNRPMQWIQHMFTVAGFKTGYVESEKEKDKDN